MDVLKKYKIKINNILLSHDSLLIESTNNISFTSPIIKGSIKFKIYNENGDEVTLANINNNDLVVIYATDNNEALINIHKIIIKNNYILNSDSSDDFYN
jgi:hypothetical protein